MHCWLSQRLLWSRACLYEHSGGGGGGGVGQEHVCVIIADFLMSTSNEMCGGLLVHTMKHRCIRKRYPLHMRVYVYRTREITSVVYGRNAENEPVSR